MVKNLTGYDRVIAAVQRITGKRWGAASWLAEQLGESRQVIDTYRKRGFFPLRHVDRIAELTQLAEFEIQPDPGPDILKLSKKWHVSIREAEIRVMRIGLAHLK